MKDRAQLDWSDVKIFIGEKSSPHRSLAVRGGKISFFRSEAFSRTFGLSPADLQEGWRTRPGLATVARESIAVPLLLFHGEGHMSAAGTTQARDARGY